MSWFKRLFNKEKPSITAEAIKTDFSIEYHTLGKRYYVKYKNKYLGHTFDFYLNEMFYLADHKVFCFHTSKQSCIELIQRYREYLITQPKTDIETIEVKEEDLK